jgi:hypothetical protein
MGAGLSLAAALAISSSAPTVRDEGAPTSTWWRTTASGLMHFHAMKSFASRQGAARDEHGVRHSDTLPLEACRSPSRRLHYAASMAHPLRSVSRAALGGLALGLGAAAIVLVSLAVLRLRVDCSALSTTECDFETEIARSIARLQAFAAVGCALVAGGLGVAIWRPRSKPLE